MPPNCNQLKSYIYVHYCSLLHNLSLWIYVLRLVSKHGSSVFLSKIMWAKKQVHGHLYSSKQWVFVFLSIFWRNVMFLCTISLIIHDDLGHETKSQLNRIETIKKIHKVRIGDAWWLCEVFRSKITQNWWSNLQISIFESVFSQKGSCMVYLVINSMRSKKKCNQMVST